MITELLFSALVAAATDGSRLCAGRCAGPDIPAADMALARPAPPASPDFSSADYDYYVAGDPRDAKIRPSAGVLLAGGGRDLDQAMAWFVKKANGGDLLVIRCSGDGAYNDYLSGLAAVDSAETIVLKSRSASYDPFVLSKIKNAEAIFIAGGDQADYVAKWKDTPLGESINSAVRSGVPVGGTSAGLAVLGRFVYSADRGGIYTDEMLRDPYNERATFVKGFLEIPHLGGVITDTHFRQRDRMGRLAGFLARISQDGWSAAPKGIGVDEQTAVLIEPDGKGRIAGKGKAYFLMAKDRPEVCRPRTPLTYESLDVFCAGEGAVFDLGVWRGTQGNNYTLSVREGVITPSFPYY